MCLAGGAPRGCGAALEGARRAGALRLVAVAAGAASAKMRLGRREPPREGAWEGGGRCVKGRDLG